MAQIHYRITGTVSANFAGGSNGIRFGIYIPGAVPNTADFYGDFKYELTLNGNAADKSINTFNVFRVDDAPYYVWLYSNTPASDWSGFALSNIPVQDIMSTVPVVGDTYQIDVWVPEAYKTIEKQVYLTNDGNEYIQLTDNDIVKSSYRIAWNPAQKLNYYQFAYRLLAGQESLNEGDSLLIKTWYTSQPSEIFTSKITIGPQSYSSANTAVVFYYSNATGAPFSNESLAPSSYMHVIPEAVSATTMPLDYTPGDTINFEITGDISYIENFNILMAGDPGYGSYSDQIIVQANTLTPTEPVSGGGGGTPTPTGPTAINDTFTVDYEGSITLTPLANDSVGSSALDVSSVVISENGTWVKSSVSASGSWVVNSDGTISFTALGGYSGSAGPITYRVTDGNGLHGTAEITGTVNAYVPPEVSAPTLTDDSYDVLINTSSTLSPLVNDSSGSSAFNLATLEISADSATWGTSLVNTLGEFIVSSDGTIGFTPATDSTGSISFVYRIANTEGAYGNPANIAFTVSPASEPAPVLTPKQYETPYNTPKVLAVLEDSTGVINSIEISASGAAFGNNVIDEEGSWTVQGLEVLFTPASTWQGIVSPIKLRAINGGGYSNVVNIDMTVGLEPAPPVIPIAPIVSPTWQLGSFRTGELEGFEIPYSSDSITMDRLGNDEMDITVPLSALSDEDRVNWRAKFEVNEKMAALIAEDGTVITAGYIEKINPNLNAETITLKVRGMKFWLASRFAVNGTKKAIENSAETWELTASPRTVAKNIVQAVLTGPGNPTCIEYPVSRTGSYKGVYTLAELKPVSEILDEISSDPLGQEIKFRPKKVGNKIIFEMLAGEPHLNDDGSSIIINLEEVDNLDSADLIEDGSKSYNRLWLESSFEGQDGTAINLKSEEATGGKLIRESKEKFDGELTTTEMAAQFSARLQDANKAARTNSLSFRDDNLTLWGATGRRLQLVGSGRSAGWDGVVRIIGMTFSTVDKIVDLSLDQIRSVYPLIRKKADIKDEIDSVLNWDRSIASGGLSSGGASPWNPGEGAGGDFSNLDLFGDEGAPTDGSAPTTVFDATFENFLNIQINPAYNDSGLPFSFPASGIQNEGNRVFFLDRIANEYVGEMTGMSSLPVENFINPEDMKDFYIRGTFLNNGQAGNFITAGIFPSALIYEKLSNFEFPGYGAELQTNEHYYSGYTSAVGMSNMASQWVSGGRLFINVAVMVAYGKQYEKRLISDDSVTQTVKESFRQEGLVYCWSSEIQVNGTLGSWRAESSPPNNEFTIPAFMSRYGDKVSYSSSMTIPRNVTLGQFDGRAWSPASMRTTLTQQQTPRIRTSPTAGNEWLSYPATTLNGSTPEPLYTVSFNGWLYAIRAYRSQSMGIWRIRQTANGIIPPEAIWVKVADTQNAISVNYGLTVIKGWLLYATSDGDYGNPKMAYRKLNSDGSVGAEQMAGDDVNTFLGYYKSNNADNNWSNEYDQMSNEYAFPENFSRIFSYGGYAYYFRANRADESKINLISIRIKENG